MKRGPIDWIQFGILVVTFISLWFTSAITSKQTAVTIESRFSRLEQRMDDSEQDRKEMLDALQRIEDRLNRK